MNILVADIATLAGFAIHKTGGEIISGSKSFKRLPGQPIGALFRKWEGWLNEQLQEHEIEMVGYELVNFPINSRGYEMIYHGMVGIMLAACFRRDIETKGFPVHKIKQAATGKGNASKGQMIAAARAQWPCQQIIDDNQADALWVLYLACQAMKVEQKKAL